MHVRCPHCRNPIELVDETPLAEVTCPSCGSSFNLAGSDTTASYHETVRTIGHFKLIEHVGVGQFGSVWKARDTELDRTVAIKIPRSETLEPKRQELFFREARAAAQLRHDNIVSVHEVGREDATIYIVSDFVDGANLREWLSARQPTPREAAELCIQLAEALHHAHEAGIVHRDLKPGNVMMDADGKPAVMDFGLAKRDAGEITMTIEGQILGTPAYMPPEQARGEGHTADRRADVYSLGVMLFEMLTGELPFRGEKRMQIVQILNDDPPFPRRLNAHIPRDLETICLKCLEKDPDRRYDTARELADDLKRFVGGEPITARPVGRLERGWRWCRRNPRLATVSATAILLLLTLAIGGPIMAAREADLAYEAAQETKRADGETKRATTALAKQQEAVRKLTASLEKNEQTIYQWVQATKSAELLQDARFKPILTEFLKRGLEHYERFIADHEDDQDPKMRFRLGKALFEVAYINSEKGSTEQAIAAYQRARKVYDELARGNQQQVFAKQKLSGIYNNLGLLYARRGEERRSLTVLQRGLAIDKELVSARPNSAVDRARLALKHYNIAIHYANLGEPTEALAEYRQALKLREQLVRRFPKFEPYQRDVARSLNAIGSLLKSMKKLKEAQTALQRAFDIRKSLVDASPSAQSDYRSDLASSHFSLAGFHLTKEELTDAFAAYNRALEIRAELVRANPAVTGYRRDLASTFDALGRLHRRAGRTAQAIPALQSASKIWARLTRENPSVVSYPHQWAQSQRTIGDLFRAQKNYGDAHSAYEKSLSIIDDLAKRHPMYSGHATLRASIHLSIGGAFNSQGRIDPALVAFQKVVAIREEQLRATSRPTDALREALGTAYQQLGDFYNHKTREHGKAITTYDKALSLRQQLVNKLPDSLEHARVLGHTLHKMGLAHRALKRPDLAIPLLQRAWQIRIRMVIAEPTLQDHRNKLRATHAVLVSLNRGDPEKALAIHKLLLRTCERLSREHPQIVEYQRFVKTALEGMGTTYAALQNWRDAETARRRADEIHRGLVRLDANAVDDEPGMAQRLQRLAEAHYRAADWRKAVETYKEELLLRERLARRYPQNATHQTALAWCLNNTGNSHTYAGDPTKALTCHRKALKIRKQIAEQDRGNAQRQRLVA